MSSDRVLDYLTEELVVEKNIVRVSCPIHLIPRLLVPLTRSFRLRIAP